MPDPWPNHILILPEYMSTGYWQWKRSKITKETKKKGSHISVCDSNVAHCKLLVEGVQARHDRGTGSLTPILCSMICFAHFKLGRRSGLGPFIPSKSGKAACKCAQHMLQARCWGGAMAGSERATHGSMLYAEIRHL
jgi:hypothetical protein